MYQARMFFRDGRASSPVTFDTIKRARSEVRRVFKITPPFYLAVITRNGEPFEIATRVYNMRRNQERIVFRPAIEKEDENDRAA